VRCLIRLEILNTLRERERRLAASLASVHRDARIKAAVAANERQRWLDQG
jgi:hypothetical protein